MKHPLFVLSFEALHGVHGVAVIDSLIDGTSSGGVRIVPDLEMDEVRMLAAEMTLKYAFCGLPRGGAKCGIRMASHLTREQRLDALVDVGRHLSAIIGSGIYFPGMDMNCGPEELRAIYRGAGLALGNLTDTSYFTAVFVAEAVRACADVLFHEVNGPLTMAVEGFGKVASHLAGMLAPDRFRIVALSTVHGAVHHPDGLSQADLVESRATHGDALVEHLPGERLPSRDDLLSLSVDILVPAARVGSIHKENVDRVTARCIVPAANAPCTIDALEVLQRRKIPVLPGFVCNAGGVLGSSLFDRGVPQSEVKSLAAGQYGRAVATLLRTSLELGCSPTELATRVASNQIQYRKDVQSSRLQRLGRRLARRFAPATRFVHRHAASDCADHFERLALQMARMEAPLAPVEGPRPMVSVVMPVYGTERFLAQAVQSVLDQSFRDFELLVLDDESPGDAPCVLAAFDDPRIRYLRHENHGPAFTRNRGVRESRGLFVAFLDSDDAWLPEKLAKQVTFLQARPDVHVTYTQRQTMDDDGQAIEGFKPHLYNGRILDELYVDNCICMSSSMLRREVFDAAGLINEKLRMSEDFDFWLRVACGHHFAAIDEPLVRYRVHSGQVSRDVEERVRVVWEIRREFDKVYGHLVSAKARNRARALHHSGKGSRACSAGQGLAGTVPHYLRALWHYPKYVTAWKGLGKAILPTWLQAMLSPKKGGGK